MTASGIAACLIASSLPAVVIAVSDTKNTLLWIAALGPIIAAVALWITNKATTKITALAAKQEVLIEKADTIHDLTNSGMSKVREELSATRQELVSLQRRYDDSMNRQLATARAATAPNLVAGGAPIPVSEEKVNRAVVEGTDAIAKAIEDSK